MAEKRMLPIGEEFFSSIRRGNFYYVDKTAMLSDFFRRRGLVTLFTRPRRFGKSLNIDMFKCFLEIGTDPSLFDGLAVCEDKEICDAHMGQYPVIALSLKDVEGRTYEEALNGLSARLQEEARRYDYLFDSEHLNKYDQLSIQEYYNSPLDEESQRNFLRLFSEMLSKHFEKKTVILIDEYDVPLDKAWQHGYYEKMVVHIRAMFSRALKTNPFLEFAILTGCLRIVRESIFTGINNFFVNSISDTAFAKYFGFTDTEVRELLNYYDIPEKYGILREWYDGYRFGTQQIYCPWDVICQTWEVCADPNAPMKPYWANSSSNYIVRDLLTNPSEATKADIERLISGEAVTKTILPELTYADFDTDDEETRENYVWSVLYSTGYLTDEKDRREYEARRQSVYTRARRLVIPNREVQDIYETQIKTLFRKKVRSHTGEWEQFCDALISGDAKAMELRLNGFLSQSISIRDTFVKKEYKENFYHGMLLGLLKGDGRFSVQSNAESGSGYLDIEVLDYANKTGCAIEVKYAEGGAFDAACSEAMQQIEDNDYTADLRQEDMETIHKYGIAFYKKSCRVQYEQD